MSIKITDLNGQELDEFIKEVEGSESYKALYQKLVGPENFKFSTKKAAKAPLEDKLLTFSILGFNEDKIKIVSTKTNNVIESTASIISYQGEKEIVTGFRYANNKIEKSYEKNYDEAFKQKLKELDLLEQKALTDGIKIDVPCLYGNWCGPGCSGPGAPIDGIDSCCQLHDTCYEYMGYFNCSCDLLLLGCLLPYVNLGYNWAIIITAYFTAQYYVNCG